MDVGGPTLRSLSPTPFEASLEIKWLNPSYNKRENAENENIKSAKKK